MKQDNKSARKPVRKNSNIIEETRNATAKGMKGITDTIEDGKTINNLLIRKSILLAEIAVRQNELKQIDKKLNDTLKQNPLNEFLSKIAVEVNKFEPKEISQLLEAIKPLTNLFDISKVLASQSTKEFSNTIKSNIQAKPQKKK